MLEEANSMLKDRVKTLESEAKMAELLKLEDDHAMVESLRNLEKGWAKECQLLGANAAMLRKELDDIKAADASKDEQLAARVNCLEGELALQKTENQCCMQALIIVSVLSLNATVPA